MRKRALALGTFALAIVALAAVVVGEIWAGLGIRPPIPSREEVWIPKNAVILDSAQVQGSPIAYAFCYDIGAFGFSISMASVREPSHQPGFLVVRGNVQHVWWTAPDTLMVGVQSLNYELPAPPKGLVVVPTLSPKPGGRGTGTASSLPTGQRLHPVGACVQ